MFKILSWLGADTTILAGFVRHGLTSAGGSLVARGLMTASQLDVAVGAVMTLVGVVLSAVTKKTVPVS